MQIVDWSPATAEPALAFLKEHYESSMFLLGNYEAFGPRRGESPNSGNFRVVYNQEGQCRGVYCLTVRGNLLIQLGDELVTEANCQALCEALLTEGIALGGVLGPWEVSSLLWSVLQQRKLVGVPSFFSKEKLYRQANLQQFSHKKDPAVRYLQPSDFAAWKPLRLAYMAEEGLKQDLSEEKFQAAYLDMVSRKVWWGLFDDQQSLTTIVALNAKASGIGQVGGVYTLPEQRKRGLGKRAMQAVMHDSYLEHGLEKMILFTGAKNTAAQKLYESLGYEAIGHFALLFS